VRAVLDALLPQLPVEKGDAGLDGAAAGQEAGEVAAVVLEVEFALHALGEKFGMEIGGVVDGHQGVPAAMKEEVRRRIAIDVIDRRGQAIGLGLLGAGAADEVHHQAPVVELEEIARQPAAQYGGQPRNGDTVTLVREPWQLPETLPYAAGQTIVPLAAGETLAWRLAD